MQCTTFCRNSNDCGAFTFDESSKECSIFGRSDLICDEKGLDSKAAYVDQTNIPSSSCGGIQFLSVYIYIYIYIYNTMDYMFLNILS